MFGLGKLLQPILINLLVLKLINYGQKSFIKWLARYKSTNLSGPFVNLGCKKCKAFTFNCNLPNFLQTSFDKYFGMGASLQMWPTPLRLGFRS